MSYGQARPGVTMLDQLPNLDDLELGTGVGPMHVPARMGPPTTPHGTGLPPGTEERYQKYIRSTHQLNPHSGMMNMEYYDAPGGYGAPTPSSSQYGTMDPNIQAPGGEMRGPPPPPDHQIPFINCVDIAKHVQDCPICSKFYKNDNTVYIIAIVVLAIVCLLLLKRVLDV